MKLALALLVSVFASSFASSAFASSEVIFQGACDNYSPDGTLRYITSSVSGDNRVKLEIRLLEQTRTDEAAGTYEVKSPILPQLERRGDVIVHKATGAVCAKWSKPLIGKRDYYAKSKCSISIKDKESTTTRLDADGFERITTKSCVRSYILNVK